MVVTTTLTSWLYAAMWGDLWRHSPLCAVRLLQPHILLSFGSLLSALLVKHSRTVTYRPPSAGTRVGGSGISLARPLTGSGLSPYCRSAPRGSASLRRTAHRAGGTIMLAHRLTCRRAVIGSIMRKLPKYQGTLLLPLRVLFWSAGWICTNGLRGASRCSPH